MSDCAVGCRQVGMHKKSCSGTYTTLKGEEVACRGCAPREAHPGLNVCPECEETARESLRLLPTLYLALLDPMRGMSNQPKVSGTKERALPINYSDSGNAPGDVRAAIRDTFRTWVRLISHTLDVLPPRKDLVAKAEQHRTQVVHFMVEALAAPDADVAADLIRKMNHEQAEHDACVMDLIRTTDNDIEQNRDFISKHLGVMLTSSQAGTLVKDLKDAYRRASRIADRHEDNSLPVVTLVDQTRLVDADTLVRWIRIDFGRDVSTATVRSWAHRGLIEVRGTHGKRALFDPVEVREYLNTRYAVKKVS